MKKLLLLLCVVCVSLTSCSEKVSLDLHNLNDLKKRFDLSDVDTNGLKINEVYEFQDNNGPTMSTPTDGINPFIYTHPDLVLVIGEINNSLWFGLFDRESGSLKYQYTDVYYPTSYFEYGEEYKYGVGCVFGIYFQDNDIIIAIQYPKHKSTISRLDLIAFGKNKKVLRTTIAEEIQPCTKEMVIIDRWANNAICFGDLGSWSIIYDIDKNEVLYSGYDIELCSTVIAKIYPKAANANIFISNTDLLHCWRIDCGRTLSITECQCTYDTVTTTREHVNFFDPYTGDSSQAPRYSFEYTTRTDNHISVVVTQTEYDGTITIKTVDVRLVNDELKVDIQ